MVTLLKHIINLTSLLITLLVFANAQATSKSLDFIKVDLKHKSYYDSRVNDTNVLSSRLRVKLGNKNIRVGDYLRQFAIPGNSVKRVHGFMADVSLNISLAPMLLKHKTLNSLEEKVEASLKEKKPFILQQVTLGVDYALSNDPQFQSLPKPTQDAIRTQLIDETTNNTIADIRRAATEKHEDRVDQIKLETTFQEVVIDMSYQMNENALLFIKAGKYQQQVATGLDDTNQTELDSMRLGRNRTQRMSTAGPTGGATIGAIKRYNDFTIQVEFAFFHDRIPFMDASEYISQVVTLSSTDYEDHKKLFDIDSGRIRINIKTNKVDMYINAGSFDGDVSYATGIIVRVTPNIKVHADYAHSERPETGKDGISVFVSHEGDIFDYPTSFYIGQERINDAPIIGSSFKEDIVESTVGGRVTIWSGKYDNLIVTDLSLNVEYYHEDRSHNNQKEDGLRTGLQFRARWH